MLSGVSIQVRSWKRAVAIRTSERQDSWEDGTFWYLQGLVAAELVIIWFGYLWLLVVIPSSRGRMNLEGTPGLHTGNRPMFGPFKVITPVQFVYYLYVYVFQA